MSIKQQQLKPGWTKVAFGDVVKLNTDRCIDPAAEGIERYVGLEHIEPEDLRVRRWGLVADGTTFTNRFKPGQVLFGKRRAYQRKVAVADFEGVCSGDIYVFEPKDTCLLPEFLPFLCQTEAFFEYAVGTSAGSLSPRTNWTQLANFEFVLPPLEEQRQIVVLLYSVENAVEAIQDLESRLEQLRKSFIIDSFSQLLRDESITTVKVAQAGEVLMGRQRAPQYDQGILPRPYLRVANVYDGFIDTSDVKQMDFTEDEFKRYKLEYGDVLLVEGHSSAEVVGRSCIFKSEVTDCCIQNTLIRFRPIVTSSEYSHYYFQYCLYARRFSVVAKQTTIAHLGSSRFASMDFPIPNPGKEQEIVSALVGIEANLQRTLERKESVRRLKQRIFESELSCMNGDGR
jgi:type I restriction enzyme S subunit